LHQFTFLGTDIIFPMLLNGAMWC